MNFTIFSLIFFRIFFHWCFCEWVCRLCDLKCVTILCLRRCLSVCVCVSAHKERTVAGWQSAWFQFVLVHMENELFVYYTSLFAYYFIIIVTFFSSLVILFCAQFSTTICSHQSVCIVHPNVINRKKSNKNLQRLTHTCSSYLLLASECFSIAHLLANSLFGLAPYFAWWIVSVEFTLSNLNHSRCALDEQQLLLRLFFLADWIVLVAHYLSKCKMKIASKRKRKNTDGLTHGKNKLIL